VNNGQLLVALAPVSTVGACAIGVVGALTFEAWLALLILIGLFLVLAYNLELAERLRDPPIGEGHATPHATEVAGRS